MSELTRQIQDLMLANAGILSYQETGSRYICTPAPTDTDEDVIICALSPEDRAALLDRFSGDGYEAQTNDDYDLEESDFVSLKLGQNNILLTADSEFYERFCIATKIAKKHNMLVKKDRIQLFQAVLYGNDHT